MATDDYPVFPPEHEYIEMSSGWLVDVYIYFPGYDSQVERLQRDLAAPFPLVIFSPGAGAPATNYENTLMDLASIGFVVAGVNWEYEMDREEDVAHRDHTIVIDLLEDLGNDPDSELYNLPDTWTCGAFGHSRGGRAAFMATGSDNRIMAASAWMPTLAIAEEVRQPVPKLLFGGSEDEVAPPGEWQTPLYQECEAPIVYLELYDGDHGVDTDIHPVVTFDFFRYHLLGDESVEPDVYGDNIKQRAESGEFRLRMKTVDGEYDSENPGGSGGEGEGWDLHPAAVLVTVVLVAVIVLVVRSFMRASRRG